ncbi:MAG: N-acetylmuramoyl-L-alanine amidase [Bacillota bacterium]|nr:N-acetylmuramoyl-L-alanine amidase [Bacillota bacterium]
MKFCIDAGHNYSGFDTGASGYGLKEQDITFYVAQKLKALLESPSMEVIMTRNALTENVGKGLKTSLRGRYELANSNNCDYFISLHCDAATSSDAKGSHVCIFANDSEAERLAVKVQDQLLTLGLYGRSEQISVRNDLAVLKETKMTSILIEMGFISNKDNANIMKYNQEGLAKAIYKGICEYLGITSDNLKNEEQDKAMEEKVTIKINGNDSGIEGVLIEGVTYSPLRKLCDALGLTLNWDGESYTADIITQGEIPECAPNSKLKSKYSIVGATHVVELAPCNIKNVEVQCLTTEVKYDNFVNSVYFMKLSSGAILPLGMAVENGKVLSNYATHDKPVSTIIIYNDNSVEMKRISNISEEKNVRFAVSGYGVYPTITASLEGFTGIYSDVIKQANRPIIGYRKNDNKIVIAVRADTTAERANVTAKNLGLDFAISLDGGGSTTLKVNGDYKFRGDGRKIYGGITWDL